MLEVITVFHDDEIFAQFLIDESENQRTFDELEEAFTETEDPALWSATSRRLMPTLEDVVESILDT